VPEGDGEAMEAVVAEVLQDVPQERTAANLGEGLGGVDRPRSKPGTAAAGQDHDLEITSGGRVRPSLSHSGPG